MYAKHLVDWVFCQTDLVIEGVLSCLGPRDLCVFVHMVVNARVSCYNIAAWQEYYWVTRQDTSCNDGVRFDRWFGGHTRLCLCNQSDNAYTKFACGERLLGLKSDSLWQQEMCYHDIGRVMWAGPTHVGSGTRHTLVVYRSGMVGVLASTMHRGWLVHPIHMPLTTSIQPVGIGSALQARGGVKQCVTFVGDNQFIGILCGRNMIVVRRTMAPQVCGTWYIASPLMLARRVAVCSTSRLVFAACSTGVLFVQRYQDQFAQQTRAHFVTIDRGNEVLGNRSVAMVAVLVPGVVLVRDYVSPRKLCAVRVDEKNGALKACVVARLELDTACAVRDLITLRYDRGVGVVCYRTEDVNRMSLWAATIQNTHNGSQKLNIRCLHTWHECPDGHVVDIAGRKSEPWLVAGGGRMWRTGSPGVLLAQSGKGSARRVWWRE